MHKYVNYCNLEDTACIQALHIGLTNILNFLSTFRLFILRAKHLVSPLMVTYLT